MMRVLMIERLESLIQGSLLHIVQGACWSLRKLKIETVLLQVQNTAPTQVSQSSDGVAEPVHTA